jgi:hypothetical protein
MCPAAVSHLLPDVIVILLFFRKSDRKLCALSHAL